MIASISLTSHKRIADTVVCNAHVYVKDQDTNRGIPLTVVTVAYSSDNPKRGMPTADVAHTDSRGVYKGRSKRISLVPGAGCTARVVSILKVNHVLLTPLGSLMLHQPLPLP
jgi:hypothetical protein